MEIEPKETAIKPDEDIVGALVHDLDSGFLDLFHAHGSAVFTAALAITGNWQDAEDLSADAFLRAYRALDEYSPARIRTLRLRPWLLTIARNHWRNTLRDSSRRPVTAALEPMHDPPDPREDVARIVGERETTRELMKLVTLLPEEQRDAVVLRHVLNLPVAEVAAILGRPEGTVKSQVSRGLRRLRELYEANPKLSEHQLREVRG